MSNYTCLAFEILLRLVIKRKNTQGLHSGPKILNPHKCANDIFMKHFNRNTYSFIQLPANHVAAVQNHADVGQASVKVHIKFQNGGGLILLTLTRA